MCFFLFLTRARNFSNCPRPKRAKIPLNCRFQPVGVRPEKKIFPRKLRKTIPDSVVPFFPPDFGTPVALGPKNGPAGLACCLLLLACLLDAQAPAWCTNNLINRLKFYELNLGDPNPNLGPWGLGQLGTWVTVLQRGPPDWGRPGRDSDVGRKAAGRQYGKSA